MRRSLAAATPSGPGSREGRGASAVPSAIGHAGRPGRMP